MTDNEIIKALECCVNNQYCWLCVLKDREDDCCYINRQKARIEELEKGELSKSMTFNSDTIKRCSAEAIREFSEEVEKELMANTDSNGDINSCFVPDIIHRLVKEMTEG